MRLLAFLLISTLALSCQTSSKIRDGKSAYERKQFALAVRLLTDEYQKAGNETKPEISYLLGESYSRLDAVQDAGNWYSQAVADGYGLNANLKYAYALKDMEDYRGAISEFEKLGESLRDPQRFRREITSCELAADYLAKKESNPYKLRNLPLNTESAEFAPALYNQDEIVFASDRSSVISKDIYKWTGRNLSKYYLFKKQNQEVLPFDAAFNEIGNSGSMTYWAAGNEIICTICSGTDKTDGFCQLYISQFSGGAWQRPTKLPFVEDGQNYGHPTISQDGNVLVFTSDYEKGFGGFDLYAVRRNENGWSQPSILPQPINTDANELFPFLDADTLYYSSDFTGGMGGLDVYMTYVNAKGDWSTPINMKSPINSGADDFGFILDPNFVKSETELKSGYVSSSRPGGKGADDIYQWTYLVPKAVIVPDTPKSEKVFTYLLETTIQQKELENPENPNSRVLRRSPLMGANYIVKNGKTVLAAGKVDETGLFKIQLEAGQDYEVIATKMGYLTNNGMVSTKNYPIDSNQTQQKLELKVGLDKIYLNKEIVLQDIYYDYDKYNIRADAKVNLNELIKLLNLNQKIKIQLASHTDCRGSEAYNYDLSQKRAQSVVNYLISSGIDASRLVPKGFGESKPAVNCICTQCKDEEHQANRRTTFSILR